jgi:hypothetical protein
MHAVHRLVQAAQSISVKQPDVNGSPRLFDRRAMVRIRSIRVTEQLADVELSADYCEQTGRLRILQDGTTLREWFPPNSWQAIASVAGARNWGTRPNLEELRALLANQIALLRTQYMG